MRTIIFALAVAAAPAAAGPPEFSHLDFQTLAVTDQGVWAIGSDSCDEAGFRVIAVRLGTDEVTYDAARIEKLTKGAVGGAAWRAGKDVYQPGDKPRVSHDGGKTWAAMDGLGQYVSTVAGTAPNAVWGLAYWQIVVTADRGKTWERVELLRPARKCR